VRHARQLVGHVPIVTCEIVPTNVYKRLRGAVAQIYNDQVSFFVFAPAPGRQVLIAWVVRPSRALAEVPLALPKHLAVDGRKKLMVETLEFLIDRLFGASAQKNGQPYLSTLKLSFVEKSRARQGRCRHRSGALFRWCEGCRGARLVVVLDESQ